MHVRKIPLQLLRCPSGNVAGPEVGLFITVSSVTDMAVKESERLAFGKGIVFIVLFS